MKKQHLTSTNFDITAKATIIGPKRTMLRRKINVEQLNYYFTHYVACFVLPPTTSKILIQLLDLTA